MKNIIILFLLAPLFLAAQISSTPTGYELESCDGDVWVNAPNAIYYDDTFYAGMYSDSPGLHRSYCLKTMKYGIKIPERKVMITGIKVSILRFALNPNTARDVKIKLVIGGKIVGDNRGTAEFYPIDEQWMIYGGDGDLWGCELTKQTVESRHFGVCIQSQFTSTGYPSTYVFTDNVIITVYYTKL
jgi:hypothetical protein